MKKVLCLLEDLGQGGAERQMVGLSILLSQKGYDVQVVTYHNDSFYKHMLDCNNIKNIYLEKAQVKRNRIYCICNYIKQEAPDVVISYLDTPSIIACIAKKFVGKFKLIVSERNTTQTISFRERIKFYLYKIANVVVPNSHSQEVFIKENFSYLSNKVRTITNFVDTDFFKPRDVLHKSNVFRILCVGRVCSQKNVILFINAISKVSQLGFAIHVDWYGGLRDDYYEKCIDKINRLSLNNIFIIHEPCVNIYDKYILSDVLCLPSIYEGYPNVVCEALSCGLPVICSNVCENSRIVINNKSGLLFNPLDVDDIVDKIVCYIKMSDEDKIQIGKYGRRFALKEFSKQVFVEKYIKIIENE